MRAALYNARRGDQRDFRILLELRNGQATAVAHGGAHLGEGKLHIILQAARIGHERIDALLKRQLRCAAHIIALPVSGPALPSPQYSFI